MTDRSPVVLWLRRDLRLSDHPVWAAAGEAGRPVVPVFICDDLVEGLGAAPKWRLGKGLEVFGAALGARGSRLILRRGKALDVLRDVVAETGAGAVWWQRLYDPDSVARDTEVKTALKGDGIEARSFAGHLLHEPWTVETKTGGFYKVYTPMWRMVKDREVSAPHAAPNRIVAPETWPASDQLADWQLGAAMRRGGAVVAQHAKVGEDAAHDRLASFIESGVADYDTGRDAVAKDGTSRLSAALALGEIGPRTCWHAGLRARAEGKAGAETWLKELIWREFAYHLMHHTPQLTTGNWKPDWDAFPWNEDPTHPEAMAWMRGRTGIRFVDAALREMYVTGTMHNRGRMIVASYLTKHLMTHWRIGLKWFEDCLVDWDPASNAMGWQWAAGSGPDAAPYFRVFNPVSQLDKFDRHHRYADTWIAEGKSNPAPQALSYFEAIPRSWGMAPSDPYPGPIVTAEAGRARALKAYETRDF